MSRDLNQFGMFFLYNSFLTAAGILTSPYWVFKLLKTGRYRRGLKERIGLSYPLLRKMDSRPVWFHAVSVGEAVAIKPLVMEFKQRHPSLDMIVSTVTETGRQMVLDKLSEVHSTIYFPLDFSPCVRRSLAVLRPRLFAMVETEIWPNFLRLTYEQGIPALILNGRISPHSFRRYKKVSFFMKEIFKYLEAAAMQSQEDASRIMELGCPECKVLVTGNLKFDLPITPKEVLIDKFELLKAQTRDKQLFVAGSTHQGEEEQILDMFRQVLQNFPNLLLIIAPRHLDRIPKIVDLIQLKGFVPVLKSKLPGVSKLPTDPVIVLDTLGELSSLYGLATLVFVGGSLVPVGGHNILEVAAHGIPPVFGPHMFNFKEIAYLIKEEGGGWQIENKESLMSLIMKLLRDPEKITEAGQRAFEVVRANRGAVRKTVDLLDNFLLQ